MNKNKKNKIYTPGYFIKRLRDNNFIVLRVFQDFADHDPRRWTVLIDPGRSSVFVTCFENKHRAKEILFSFEDGNNLFKNNFMLKTESIEVVVNELINAGVQQGDSNSLYYKQKSLNTNDEGSR